MNSNGFLSLTLSLILGGALAGCGTPAATQPNQSAGNDTYLLQARMAMTSYQEADASFNDSQSQASQSFTTKILLEGSSDAELSNEELIASSGVTVDSGSEHKEDEQGSAGLTGSIGAMLNTNLANVASASASAELFHSAAGSFNSQLASTPGVSLDSQGMLSLNPGVLQADIRADLNADADLNNPSLDLNGQLKAGSSGGLQLRDLASFGYSGSGSNMVTQTSAEGNTEAMLLTFKNSDAELTNRVRVISRANTSGDVRSEFNLRLESQANGFSRTGMREIRKRHDGSAEITSNVAMKLKSGAMMEISEKRFANTQGAGSGVGSFTLSHQGQSWSGGLRSVTSADGKMMLMFEPSDASRGRLILQNSANGRGNLAIYNGQGQLSSTSEIDFEAAADAMVQG